MFHLFIYYLLIVTLYKVMLSFLWSCCLFVCALIQHTTLFTRLNTVPELLYMAIHGKPLCAMVKCDWFKTKCRSGCYLQVSCKVLFFILRLEVYDSERKKDVHLCVCTWSGILNCASYYFCGHTHHFSQLGWVEMEHRSSVFTPTCCGASA